MKSAAVWECKRTVKKREAASRSDNKWVTWVGGRLGAFQQGDDDAATVHQRYNAFDAVLGDVQQHAFGTDAVHQRGFHMWLPKEGPHVAVSEPL